MIKPMAVPGFWFCSDGISRNHVLTFVYDLFCVDKGIVMLNYKELDPGVLAFF